MLHEGKPQALLPIDLKPKQKLTIYFDVNFTTNNLMDQRLRRQFGSFGRLPRSGEGKY